MKLKTKLFLGYAFIFVIVIILAVTAINALEQQKKRLDEVVNNNYERVNLAKNLINQTQNSGREIREILLVGSNYDPEPIAEMRQQASIMLNALTEIPTDNEEKEEVIGEFVYLNSAYDELIQQVLTLVLVDDIDIATKLLLDDNRDLREQLVDRANKLTLLEEESMDLAIQNSENRYTYIASFMLIISGIAAILVIIITLLMTKNISESIKKVSRVISSVPNHSTTELPRIEITTNDELGEIANSYNSMAKSLEDHAIQESKLNDQLMNENWMKTKFAEVGTMIQGTKDLKKFSEQFIQKIAKMLNATYGALYIKDEKSTFLHNYASYAGNKKELIERKIQIGEGLVGQCALDNKKVHIESLPENYIKIQSGLGQANPKALLILPIEFDGEVLGVIELAKLEQFTTRQIRLLEQICNVTGTSINRILDHMKIEELLAESQALTEELQAQTEELQSQSEELQQQQEELSMTNEQLHEEYRNSEEKAKQLEKIQVDLEQKNQDIELSSKYKTEFLANMSHELRTPLNSMLILSELLSQNIEGNLSEKQAEHALTIHSAGKDLLNLINDILDLSKIEAGKTDVYPEEIVIHEVQAFIERQFLPVSKEKGLEFIVTVDEDAPSYIYTDEIKLKQIIKNLLSNAFKFTANGHVELQFKKVSSPSHDVKLKIVVIDTGIGIPKEQLESIFEAFSQGDGTTTRRYGGTGLGLSISKELAHLLGGYLEVDSISGKGSTFILYMSDYQAGSVNQHQVISEIASTNELVQIPNVNKKEQNNDELLVIDTTTAETSNQEVLENKVVLVVDDDMRNIFSLTTALETQNMEVLFAENGREALDILNENPHIDIVLMDIMMPEMNGYEAMGAIRQNNSFIDLPIIALTAKAMKNDREKCLEAGASDYISKPINLEQLISLIKVWLYR
ncbi:response regulator [Bacillus sp. FJAT-45350]|uniref:response regulator n=1 Tax=Bacillus sp. FJAT-45350 TaxID=2011014 RepID=UPI000BB8BFE5|nr:response regulator [Bacillus sp. FJAT-45350]